MSRTGTGRRLGSSRSRLDRNPRGSATRGLHDSLPHVGAVEVKTLGLGLGTNVQDTLIVTWQDEGELALDVVPVLSLIHISEPTRRTPISYAVFCLKKKKKKK